jgi:hypothetical protein
MEVTGLQIHGQASTGLCPIPDGSNIRTELAEQVCPPPLPVLPEAGYKSKQLF